ncbi:DUF2812 domain-containing protein [Irregularibacter muris]|uniref:DUF2812 domain-containing protein n=1 Tax=Irregularibacter muris TaxID=1796619 RepID=A0AAE3HGY6_9FIRM|nr:DUF2812 domain-containing protein [Irregularibacter muris]MCR1898849.1 DUF2812 domain-containing protein [Irregularibacter muris]
MNYKMQIKYINITNYPDIERYLEKMAAKGWMLKKILMGTIFIFRRIKPEELEFSISPYEVETAFTRKSKEELKEFESVCESVGWNYCTKSFDLHIYYKRKDFEALELHTDKEEEFRMLEKIGRKQIKSYYFLIPMGLLLMWFQLGDIHSLHFMKSGLAQILTPMMPIVLLVVLYDFFHLRKFLKINERNIELGKGIRYSYSKLYPISLGLLYIFLILFVFLLYILYNGLFLGNKVMLVAILPATIGLVIGQLYRMFVKPSSHSKSYKKGVFVVMMILAIIIPIGLGVFSILDPLEEKSAPRQEEYKTLLHSDFGEVSWEEEGTLLKNRSILVPRSYEYFSESSIQEGLGHLETHYAQTLTENLGKRLVRLYKKEEERAMEGRYYPELEHYYGEGNVRETDLFHIGLSMKDYEELKEKDNKTAIRESIKRIKARSIEKIDPKAWNAEEGYYLNFDKTTVVLRKEKEVFYLSGKEFDDPKVIEISKKKLGWE